MLLKFKDFVDLLESVQQPILEGGAYGHLMHPFDDLEMTLADMKELIEITVEGAFTEDNFVFEKTDGANLMFSWINGEIRFARNGSHIKNYGENSLSVSEIKLMFKGRGDIETAFSSAVDDLNSALGKLSEKNKLSIFDNGKKFASVEVISPISQNVIPYGANLLIFHGTIEYDQKGKAIGEDKKAAQQLTDLIKEVNAHIQKTFFIKDPNNLTGIKLPDTDKKLKYYLGKLDKIVKDNDLTYNNNLYDCVVAIGKNKIAEYAKKDSIDLSKDSLTGLAKRIADIDKSYSVTMIKNDLGVDSIWFLNLEKTQGKKIKKEIYSDLESLFLELGADIMKTVTTFLSFNPTAAAIEMKKNIEASIADIKINGSAEDVAKMEYELQRLSKIGTLEDIVPSEGIVFYYKGKTYKYTGLFAILNQISAITKFKI